MTDKFKLAIILGYFGLAFFATCAVVLIMIFRPDATATIIQFVGTVLGIASTGAVTFYMLGKQANQIAAVHTQVNGNLSKVTAERDSLQAQLLSVVGTSPAQQGASEV